MKHDADISRNNVSYAGLAQRVPADDAAADSVASDEAASPPSVDWAAVVAEAGWSAIEGLRGSDFCARDLVVIRVL